MGWTIGPNGDKDRVKVKGIVNRRKTNHISSKMKLGCRPIPLIRWLITYTTQSSQETIWIMSLKV